MAPLKQQALQSAWDSVRMLGYNKPVSFEQNMGIKAQNIISDTLVRMMRGTTEKA
jgi:hypothetical protein